MLGDVLTACVATGRTFVVTGDEPPARLRRSSAPSRRRPGRRSGRGGRRRARASGQRRGARRQRGRSVRRAARPSDPRRRRPSWMRSGSSRRRTGRRTRSCFPARPSSRRSTAPGSANRFREHFDAQGVIAVAAVIPNLCDDVDTMDDLRAASAFAPARARRRRSASWPAVKVALLSGGVGGARFARGLVDAVDPGDVTVIGNVGDDLEVLGLAVSPDLDSILYALAGLHDEERGWGRAGETWEALETRRRARRRGLVPARRPRSRAPPRPQPGAARRRAALGGDGAARAGSRGRGADPPGDGRSAAHLDRDAGRQLPVPGVVRRPRPPRRGRRRPLRRRDAARPRPACSRRSPAPTRS